MEVKISAYQLFCASVLIPCGTALLFLITPNARQDAWVSMLIYILPAILLQIIYVYLWKSYPDDTLVMYMPKVFGKVIGLPLSIIYIIFFAYEAARSLRDMMFLIKITTMPRLSEIAIGIVLICVVGYCVYLGIENICRATHIILPLLVIFFMLEWIFLFTTPNALKFYNLKPIFEKGILSDIKEGWKLITFPYGETILITMLYPLVVEKSKVKKASILAVIFQGILLSLSAIMFIAALGVDFAADSLFPLLQTMRIMRIGETFDRLDVFLVIIMIINGVIKISFYTYGATLGASQLVKLKDTKYLAAPFSIIIFFAAILIAKNYPQHIYIGQTISLTYIHLPLEIIIPILAAMILFIKKKCNHYKKY